MRRGKPLLIAIKGIGKVPNMKTHQHECDLVLSMPWRV